MKVSQLVHHPAFARCERRGRDEGREGVEVAGQVNLTSQYIRDVIKVIDSTDVNIISFIGQEAVTIQVAIQLVLVIIIRLFAEEDEAEKIVTELLQVSAVRQAVSQEIIVVDSEDVNIINIDNELSIELQLLIEIVIALIVELAIF